MNLPSDFIAYTHALLGDANYGELVEALKLDSPVSIRLNRLKTTHDLTNNLQQVPWCATGCYLPERLTFTFDPLFHAGSYYVQEASSMFLDRVLRQYIQEPVVMLDLCAAPGGKSTNACSALPEGSLLVANEVIRSRSKILVENLTKWGSPNIVVTNNDPADFSDLPSFFDVILADVPCSGEGMFRKDATAIEEWSLNNVEICRQRQQRIIADIWPSLKPGGILIYSTCTYNTKENEENIHWIQQEFGAVSLKVDVSDEWNITDNLLGLDFPVYRFLPYRTRGEGFFLAVLRKPEEDSSVLSFSTSRKSIFKKDKGSKKDSSFKQSVESIRGWLINQEEYQLSENAGFISAFSKQYVEELNVLQRGLRIVHAGVPLGQIKGKDIIPAHGLAMNQLLCLDRFPCEEVTYEQAITYLRKETVSISETAPRGYVLLKYKNVPLGFIKNIGNRSNNLYPQEWRIRSGYLPQDIRIL